jgi:hypothetical protein
VFRLHVVFRSGTQQTLSFPTALTRLLVMRALDAYGIDCVPDDRPVDPAVPS